MNMRRKLADCKGEAVTEKWQYSEGTKGRAEILQQALY